VLYRAELETRVPQVVAAWRKLEGRISETDMQRMNSRVELEKLTERRVATDFLTKVGLLRPEASKDVAVEGAGERMLRASGQPLALVALSLAAAIVVAVPLGILAAYRPALGQG